MESGKTKKALIAVVSVVIGLPILAVVIAAGVYQLLDRSTATIELSGEKREYLLYVPESYDPDTSTALVVSLHGAGLWPAQQMNMTGWSRLADEHGFIVAYPSGHGMPKFWIRSQSGAIQDSDFISKLIDTLMAEYNIDPTRIYADGLSNGGGMALVLSCTMSERIAAIGLVAAAPAAPTVSCNSYRPVPTIAFHGTADSIVPFEGGPVGGPFKSTGTVFPPVREWISTLSERNDCMPSPAESVAAPGVTRIEYAGCAEDSTVILYVIQDGGHTWPGGKPMPEWLTGPTSDAIDATALTWAFFQNHLLSQQTTPAHRE